MEKREKTLEVVTSPSPPAKVSGSRVGRFLACPSSELLAPDGYRFSQNTPEAAIGSAAHAAIAQVVQGQEPDILAICHDHGADQAEVGMLVRFARQAWEELRLYVPEPRVEYDVEGELTYGRADVLHSDGATLVVLDWDFGWVGTDKRWQLKAYADAARTMFGMPQAGAIMAVHVLARKGKFITYELDEAELANFRERVRWALRRCGIDYAPNVDTCRFCPRQLVCQPRADYLRQCVALMPYAVEALTLDDSGMAQLYPRWKEVKRLVEAFDKVLGARLADGTPLDLGNGKALTIVEQEYEQIDPMLAWSTMQAHLTSEQIARALTVGKGELLNAVAEGAGRGQKGKAKEQFMDELRAAGAVSKHTRKVKTEVDQ